MFSTNKPYTFDRVVRGMIGIAAIAASIWLLRYLSDVLIPFAVALLLAYLLNPVVVRLQRRLKSRHLAVAVTLLGSGAVLTAALLIVVPRVVGEAQRLGVLLQEVLADTQVAERVARVFPEDFWQALRTYIREREIDTALADLDIEQLVEVVWGRVLPGAWEVVVSLLGFVVGLVGLAVIGLYLVFLLLDYPHLRDSWHTLLPPAWRGPVLRFVSEADAAMHRYFRAQATVAAIVGILFAVGFEIIGLPLGLLLGLFIGLLNMVPYLQVVGLAPAFVLAVLDALAHGDSVWLALGAVALVFVVVQSFQDMVLVRRIMGPAMGLNPAMILLSLSIWGKLLGVLGLLIALPITCLLLAWWRRMMAKEENAEETSQSTG